MYSQNLNQISRPKSIRISKRRIINANCRDLKITKINEFNYSFINSLLKTEDTAKVIFLKCSNKSIQNNLDSPINNITAYLNHSSSEESSPLFYPAEPRIQTSISKNRSETPKPNLVAKNKVKSVFEFKKRTKWKSLCKEVKFDAEKRRSRQAVHKGKVHKGLCDYSNLASSPVRFQNFKLVHNIKIK